MLDDSFFGLRGTVGVVSGGTRGIGLASARLLAQLGANLAIIGRTESSALHDVCSELSQFVEVLPIACDVSRPAEIESAYRTVKGEFGKIDFLVNCAGIMKPSVIGMTSSHLVEETMTLNVTGAILQMQAASRLMRTNGGSIINLSSIIGRNGAAGQVAYGASKAAVIGMTLSAAKELGARQIRVNAVAPGFIDTDMTSVISQQERNRTLESIKLERVGTAEDVAKVVVFLASDQSRYVTGQVIGVDGGMLI